MDTVQINAVTCAKARSQVSRLKNGEKEKCCPVHSSETRIKREIEVIILDSDDELPDNKNAAPVQQGETCKNLKDSDLTLLKEKEEGSDKGTDLEMSGERYPKRKIARKHYEEEIFNEDDFIFCDDCQLEYEGDCPFHGPLFLVCSKKIVQGMYADRALHTLPWFLSLSNSDIKDAGLGVWTKVELPKNVVFGPYEGVVVQNDEDVRKTQYAWQILRRGKVLHYVDASNNSFSNWLKYVNRCDKKEHQNLVPFQYKEKIYYRTLKEVKPRTELLICYSNRYVGALGKDPPTKNDQERPHAESATGSHECDICYKLFENEKLLVDHRKNHRKTSLNSNGPQNSYSKSFSTDMSQHLSTQNSDKSHECPECGKAFTRKYSIKAHLLIHKGEMPFECIVCSKKFREKRRLNWHLKVHTGQAMLWICPTCDKGFYAPEDLKRHQRCIHSAQMPHKCQYCDYRSNRSKNIQRHIKRVHAKK